MAGTRVPAGVVVEVELVVCLCVPPLASRKNFSNDLVLPPFLANLLGDILGYRSLLLVVCEDSRSVLRTSIRSLSVGCGRVVHSVEELDKLSVRDLLRIIDDLQCLGVYTIGQSLRSHHFQ